MPKPQSGMMLPAASRRSPVVMFLYRELLSMT
jgi:hypothetical protein